MPRGTGTELQHIRWDILGICETRLSREVTTIRDTYCSKTNPNSHIGRVAIMIQLISKTCAISERVIYVMIKLKHKYTL